MRTAPVVLALEASGRGERAAVGREGHGLERAGQVAERRRRVRTGLDRADEQLGGRASAHLAPGAGAGGQQLAVGRECHGPDVAALARAREGPQLGVSQPVGVVPLPGAEVGRAAVQQLVGQGDVVVEVLAIGQVDPADRVATPQRFGPLGGLDRTGDGQHALALGLLLLSVRAGGSRPKARPRR